MLWKTFREVLGLPGAHRDYKGRLGNPIGLSDVFRDSLGALETPRDSPESLGTPKECYGYKTSHRKRQGLPEPLRDSKVLLEINRSSEKD